MRVPVGRLHPAILALTLLLAPGGLVAQMHDQKPQLTDSATLRENAVKRQRQGAGLRAGTWQTTGLSVVSGASYSTLPALEGYWQKGLDQHVAIETSGGFWGRTQRDSNGRVSSFAIPMLTSIVDSFSESGGRTPGLQGAAVLRRSNIPVPVLARAGST